MTQAPDPEAVRATTRAVLDRPEFGPDAADWFNRILTWIFEQIPEWSLANPVAARILLVVLSVVLIALLVHLGFTIVREFESLGKRDHSRRGSASSLAPLAEITSDWREAVRLARSAVDEGNIHAALWITHRVLLSALDHAGILAFRKWKTNGDYVSECRHESEVRPLLIDLTNAYERVVYAHDAIGTDEAERLLNDVERFAGEVRL